MNLARILRCFHIVSGLKVNFSKSKVYGPCVLDRDVERGANILGCEVGVLPFKYLGGPVGANMNLKKHWKPIIDRFNSKLSSWKARSMSFGGRVTLIKVVLGSLPNYYLSLFKAPAGIIEQLEGIRRKFLWGVGGSENCRKIPWIAWDKITASKENGGLGVGSLKSLNIGLLVKWWWRLRKEPTALWSKIVVGIHNLERKPPDNLSIKAIAGVWNNIAGVAKELQRAGLSFHQIFSKGDGTGDWKCKLSSNGGYYVSTFRDEFNKSFSLDLACDNIKWIKEVRLK